MKSLSIALSGAITGLKTKAVSFVYPALCSHCQEKIESHKWLCALCGEQIELTDPVEGIRSSTVQALGSALSFLKEAKGPLAEEVAKTMAALMVFQLQRLKWSLPDSICPSPRDPFNLLLAKHLSIFLQVPTIRALKSSHFFSPLGYKWRGTPYLSDQKLLIVDILTPNLEELALLEEVCPKEIFYLGFLEGA